MFNLKTTKQIFIFKLILLINFSLSIIYASLLTLDETYHNDSLNYFLGYEYLISNPFDLNGAYDYFGRTPEFILQYLYSILGGFVNISSQKSVIILNTTIGFLLLSLYCRKSSLIFKENLAIYSLLISMVPLGLFIQTARQAISFYLILLITTYFKKDINKYIISTIILMASHVGSLFIIVLLLAKDKLNLIKYYLFISFTLITFIIIFNKYEFIRLLLSINEESVAISSNIDIYTILLILTINYIFIYLKDVKPIEVILANTTCLIFLYSSNNFSIIYRIFFGFSWFWIISKILFEIKYNGKLISKLNSLSITFIIIKSIYIIITIL
jgi:hypothetical protein